MRRGRARGRATRGRERAGARATAAVADDSPPPAEEPVDVDQEEPGGAAAAPERPTKKQKHPKLEGIAHWSSVETEVR